MRREDMVSEKMMEDAISSEPEKYLGEKGLRLVARQYGNDNRKMTPRDNRKMTPPA
jgi:hypothetical protein